VLGYIEPAFTQVPQERCWLNQPQKQSLTPSQGQRRHGSGPVAAREKRFAPPSLGTLGLSSGPGLFRSGRPFWTSSEKTTLRIPSFSRISRTWAITSRRRTWSASVASWEACTTLALRPLTDHFEYRIQEFVLAFEVAIDRRRDQARLSGRPALHSDSSALGGDQAQSGLGQLFLSDFGIEFFCAHLSIL